MRRKDTEIKRQLDQKTMNNETERQRDEKTTRPKDKGTKRQGTKRQRDQKTSRPKDIETLKEGVEVGPREYFGCHFPLKRPRLPIGIENPVAQQIFESLCERGAFNVVFHVITQNMLHVCRSGYNNHMVRRVLEPERF
jgi:hypothetical protein